MCAASSRNCCAGVDVGAQGPWINVQDVGLRAEPELGPVKTNPRDRKGLVLL